MSALPLELVRTEAVISDQAPLPADDDATVVPIDRVRGADGPSTHGGTPDAAGVEGVARPEDLPTGTPEERVIARGIVEGRRWAFTAAFERWSGLVHGVARKLVGRDAADDVTQQVFVEAWRTRTGFAPDRGVVPGWLVGITRNVARAHLRRHRPGDVQLGEQHDPGHSGGIDRSIDALLVADAFVTLPLAQRSVLQLTVVEQYTQAEAAALLGIPLGTLKTRQRRGLAALRDALDDTGDAARRTDDGDAPGART